MLFGGSDDNVVDAADAAAKRAVGVDVRNAMGADAAAAFQEEALVKAAARYMIERETCFASATCF